MNTTPSKTYPLYFKFAMVLIILIASCYISILGKEIISPLIFSLLFSILLLPLASFFERKLKLKRGAAAGISVLLLVFGIFLLLYFVGSQIQNLSQDWPLFEQQLNVTRASLQQWVQQRFHINMTQQMNYVNDAANKMLSASTTAIAATVLSLSSILLFLVFTMIYTFFMLFYRRLLVKFLIAVFKEDNSNTVLDIIEQIQYIVRKYILGLLLEMSIVAVACCLAFWILGIKYAVLLGLITGLFNIIPYIGIFSALLLSTLITFATAAGTTKIILVIVILVCIHLIDSNVLLPMIVGSKVKINALITVLGIIIGEMLWGIPGMFLSIPVIAIAKIIFDRVDSLKPWGMLLGDEKDENPKHKGNIIKEAKAAG